MECDKTYFEEAGTPIPPVPINLTVDLKEKRPTSLSFSANTSSQNVATVSAQATLKNYFGNIEKLDVNFSVNPHQPSNFVGEFEYSRPLFSYGKDKVLNGSLFCTNHEPSQSRYRETRIGTTVTVASGSNKLSYELCHRNLKATKGATEAILRETGEHVKSSLKYNFTLDSRLQQPFVRSGALLTTETELAGLGGSVYHLKHQTSLARSFVHASLLFLSLRFHYGVIFPLSSANSRISDRFFLGGTDSFRGCEYHGMGPRSIASYYLLDTPSMASSVSRLNACKGDSYGGDFFCTSSVVLGYPIALLPAYLTPFLFFNVGNCCGWNEGYPFPSPTYSPLPSF
eukprot:TRINITY_DN6467_c0_g2_i1.p1 TRINITY_DN6467_c0_g2~~TRINITY_DN6467_c0_g2_i1.p1  ORF type:complete len:382 (+),score=69.17 TRINITY_DN6467_c0_g2_i1:121-1146(+)